MNRKREKRNRRPRPEPKRLRTSGLDPSRMLLGSQRHDWQESAYLPTSPRKVRSDRHQSIGLALASLLAGFLLIINVDRSVHQSPKLADGESRHGWPAVYLTRNFLKVPAIYYPHEIYAWPYPPVYNESREFVWPNLLWNFLVAGILTVGSYYLISGAVRLYDDWRYRERT
jgi:hypothetical protein